MNKANDTAVAIRWIIVLLTLSIAALFVGNMLSSSVDARRLEFGTLRAIGVPTRTILWLVAAESLLICIAGSAVGIAFSLGLGSFINVTIAVQYGLDSLYVANAGLFATMALLAVTLGVDLRPGTCTPGGRRESNRRAERSLMPAQHPSAFLPNSNSFQRGKQRRRVRTV